MICNYPIPPTHSLTRLMKIPTIISAIAFSLLALIDVEPAHGQQPHVLSLTNTLNGTNSVVVTPGNSFTVSLTLNSTVSSVSVDYFLQILNGGSSQFRITGRDLSGSRFSQPITSNSIALQSSRALLDPQNDDNLGASVSDPNLPNSAGSFLISNLTLQVLPGTGVGFYTLSTANASVGDAGFNDNPVSNATFSVNVVPEPATTLLLFTGTALGLLTWKRRQQNSKPRLS